MSISEPTLRVDLCGSELRITIPKIAHLVSGAKALPGARWMKLERRWKVPMTSFNEVREFAEKNGLELSDELRYFIMPERPRRPGLEIRGNYLWVSVPHDRVKWTKAKELIPGIIFDTELGGWNAPKSSLCEAVHWCDIFNVTVPDMLRSVVKIQVELIDKLSHLSASIDGVRVSLPGLDELMMSHQHVAVYYVNRVHGRAFIADDMGVGKTLSAIAALEFMNSEERPSYPALVICPPRLGLNWQKEYARWLPGRSVQILTKKADVINGSDVTIVGYSIIAAKQDELMGQFRSLICDESHAFKTQGAARTKAAKTIAMGRPARIRGQPGVRIDGIPKDGNVLCLTGTPITIRPMEFVPQLQILGLLDELTAGEKAFYNEYCGAFTDSHKVLHIDGATNLVELNRRLRGIGYVRRERLQVIDDLPPYFPNDILVALDSKSRAEYDKAEADIVAYLMEEAGRIAAELGEDIRSARVRAGMKANRAKHLVKISVLRKWSGLGKIAAVKEWIEPLVEQGKSILIGAHHREVVDAYAAVYGGHKIMGGMSTKQVEDIKADFQAKEFPVLVCSIQATKEGHTLTAATECVPVEFPWTSTDYDQWFSRAWRKGQTEVVNVTAMLGDNTMDVKHFDKLARRRLKVNQATVGVHVDVGFEMVDDLYQKGLDALAAT